MATMKKIKYVGPHEAAEFVREDPATGVEEWVTVKRLAQVEVPAAQANRMVEQEDNWTLVEAPKAEAKDDPKPAAAKADPKDEG